MAEQSKKLVPLNPCIYRVIPLFCLELTLIARLSLSSDNKAVVGEDFADCSLGIVDG